MTSRWMAGLALAAIGLAFPLYFALRPTPPAPPAHSDRKELLCLDRECGFRGLFTEEEAMESVRVHGAHNREGVDLFHCPSCRQLSLYRSELAPLPFDQ